ncbi:hypothetical protein GCM10023189_42960 [Nibrella saemangeumensis]|uniref:Phage integrase, N-terminal SAM-like domain n=1 Tax=Nibrella saemangeumensis TaxID=1084526 RepID=A0ABP8NAR3_9BACT
MNTMHRGLKCSQATLADFTSIWNEIIVMLGIKVSDANVSEHRDNLRALSAFMSREYPHLTLDEIRQAYTAGVTRKLGIEMYAELNARQVGNVIDAFMIWRRRELHEEIQSQRLLSLPETPQPTPEELERKMVELFRFAWKAIEVKGSYIDFGNHIYDWLDSKGLIPFSDSRKWEFVRDAEKRLKAELTAEGSKGFAQEHKAARRLAEVMAKVTDFNDHDADTKARIRVKAKQIAFVTLIKEQQQLEVHPDEFLQL